MKKVLKTLLCISLVFLCSSCLNKEEDNHIYDKKIKVNIEMRDYGTINIELYPDVAPITVNHFIKLVKDGFYDGLTFHRVVSGFMIQGGDPTGTGKGGITETIKGEFSLNGVENPLKHERGVVSMARGETYDSASCQFFIVHKTDPTLDGRYAAFGRVINGMDIVDRICNETKIENSYGSVSIENQPVINKIYVVEGE